MRISNRDKGILLGLLGFVLAVLSYVLVFNPMTLKNQELKNELATLQTREAELLELEKNMDDYKGQIVSYKKHIDEMVAKFPAEVKPESEIMYAVELEDQLDVEFSTLNYGTPTYANFDAFVTDILADFEANGATGITKDTFVSATSKVIKTVFEKAEMLEKYAWLIQFAKDDLEVN